MAGIHLRGLQASSAVFFLPTHTFSSIGAGRLDVTLHKGIGGLPGRCYLPAKFCASLHADRFRLSYFLLEGV